MEWDTEAANTVSDNGPLAPEYAEREFDRLVQEGWLAFGTDEKNESVQLKKFDPTYPKTTLSPPFVGG